MGTSEGARKGHTPESDAKRREAMRRKWQDPEYRDKRARLEASPEMKAARSNAMKVANNDLGKRHQHSEYMKNRFASDEGYRTAQKEWIQKAADDPIVKEARSEAMKRAWRENPELFNRSLENIWKIRDFPTSLELTVAAELAKHGVVYLTRYLAGRYELDIFIPERNLDIECDGEYWHSGEHFPWRPAHDAKRDAWLASKGYKVLRLSEQEIKDGSFVFKLQDVLKK